MADFSPLHDNYINESLMKCDVRFFPSLAFSKIVDLNSKSHAE